MRFAYFPGCKIPREMPGYDRAIRAVMNALGVQLVEPMFNCCGYPVRHQDFLAGMFSAARNIALARAHRQTLLTPCQCCYGNLKQAQYWMAHSPELRREIMPRLAEEGLEWEDGLRVVHLLTALDEDVGPDRIRRRVRSPLEGLSVAAHYGCHALRPAEVTRFDDPLAPTIFERLVALTGAEPVDWPLRLECCGNPLWGRNNRLSIRLMRRKTADASAAGAALMATGCTHCQIQFETIQAELGEGEGEETILPALLYPQLLGWSFGIAPAALGVDRNPLARGWGIGG